MIQYLDSTRSYLPRTNTNTKTSKTSKSSSKQSKSSTQPYTQVMGGGKFLSIRKPMSPRKSRSPSIKKCKSNCNCATCKTEKARQEYDKRYRDASKERQQRKSRRNKKSPRKRI
jgi:hypothetical protein